MLAWPDSASRGCAHAVQTHHYHPIRVKVSMKITRPTFHLTSYSSSSPARISVSHLFLISPLLLSSDVQNNEPCLRYRIALHLRPWYHQVMLETIVLTSMRATSALDASCGCRLDFYQMVASDAASRIAAARSSMMKDTSIL